MTHRAGLYGCMAVRHPGRRQDTVHALDTDIIKIPRSIDTLSVVTRPPSPLHLLASSACQRESVSVVGLTSASILRRVSMSLAPSSSPPLRFNSPACLGAPHPVSGAIVSLRSSTRSLFPDWCQSAELVTMQEVLPAPPATLASPAWAGWLRSSSPWRRPSLARPETTTRCSASPRTLPSRVETKSRWTNRHDDI